MQTRFTYDYRRAELAGSAKVLNRALYGSGRTVYLLLATFPAFVLLGFIAVGAYSGWWGDWYLAAMLYGCAFVLIYSRFAAPAIRKRLMKPPTGQAALEGREIGYDFGDDGYRITTQYFEGFQKWAGVDRIIETPEMVLIVLGANAHFLPGRLFASDKDRRTFVDWALQKIHPEARARSLTGEISPTA
ncbi:MAG TPA: YcxB family protein [Hyphomonadaceae bacterium]|nr:YcxB family protein [Hyphomonadaceae bacterium]